VFFRQCTDLIHQNKSIFPLAGKVVLILAALSIVPFSIIGIWGKELFSFVFGAKWAQSGEMATIMVPWLMMNFLASPISYIAIVMKRQKSFFWINLLGTLSLIFVVSLPYIGSMHFSFYEILRLLSISQSIFLLIVLVWMLVVAKNNRINQ
jgi:O-antigen/teichoic acid export membrane protein